MSKSNLFLGIDTSCYTTSVAADTGDTIIHVKKPLTVKEGECGLRQSEAVFQHIKNLPICFDEIKEKIDFSEYDNLVVSASSKPRNIQGSYMPVFLTGYSFAKVISDTTNAVFYETSHQDGHIMAAIHSCKQYSLLERPFIAYHLSGGTTEMLYVIPDNNSFECKIVGGTLDLPAGQFVDRIGVKLGMNFPCGKYLDATACGYSGGQKKVKTCVKGEYINFSGEETRYERLIESCEDKGLIAYSVMKCISRSIKESIVSACKKYNTDSVLLVGGVSSSKFLRNELLNLPSVYFAEPELSTDNAVGVCELGKRMFENSEIGA